MTQAAPLQEMPTTYHGAPQTMNALYFRPQGEQPAPGIVLLHDVYGVTDHTRDAARRLAGAGYAVLAPDLFTRGDGPSPPWPPPKREETAKMVRYPDRRTVADVLGAVASLKTRPGVIPEKIGVMGFSFGARYALFAAQESSDIAAAAFFYPVLVYPEITEARPVQPLKNLARLKPPALVFFGDSDMMVALTNITLFRAALEGLGKPYEFTIYPGVGHGFMNGMIKPYRPKESEEAWAKTLAFFQRHLKG
jgi:carboxymethylenebutenolidase